MLSISSQPFPFLFAGRKQLTCNSLECLRYTWNLSKSIAQKSIAERLEKGGKKYYHNILNVLRFAISRTAASAASAAIQRVYSWAMMEFQINVAASFMSVCCLAWPYLHLHFCCSTVDNGGGDGCCCCWFSIFLLPASDVNGHSYLKEIKIINFYDFNKLKIIVFIAWLCLPSDGAITVVCIGWLRSHHPTTMPGLFN